MGPSYSKQTCKETANVMATSVMDSTVNCVNYVSGSNIVDITGVGNVLSGVNQQLTIKVNSPCVAVKTQAVTFSAKLADSVAQKLKKKSVAMTQWLDDSHSTLNTHIKDNVTTNVVSSTVQNCMNKIDSHNIVNINGTGNVVKNIVQDSTTALVASCMSSNSQSSKAITGITDAVSQTADIKSENPLNFLTHMIDSIAHGGEMMIAAVVFIIVICVVGIFLLIHHSHNKKRAAAAAPPPQYAAQPPQYAAQPPQYAAQPPQYIPMPIR